MVDISLAQINDDGTINTDLQIEADPFILRLQPYVKKETSKLTKIDDVAVLVETQKEVESEELILNQIGLTDCLEKLEKDKLRYCVDTKTWHICERGIWKTATPAQAACRIEDLYKHLEYLTKKYPESSSVLAKTALKVADYSTTMKLLNRLSGRDKMIIRLKDMDSHNDKLVVGNGVVNLVTGVLEATNPCDYHSLYTDVPYVPGSKSTRWLQFLNEIFPDHPEVIRFLQIAIGMSLFGDETELFFICFGEGANGKSVFLDVIKTILQEYAEKASITTFISKDTDSSRARSDVVRLAGKRFIVASENKKEVELDTGLIKEWTGDKEIVARGLYASEIKFEPRGTIWFATNHKPRIDDDSQGTWRRCRMVHFDTTIPEAQRDTHLPDDLIAHEAEGILDWMIQGAVMFAKEGLVIPEKIRHDTEEYQEEQQPALQFVRENIGVGFDEIAWSDVTSRFGMWLIESGLPSGSARSNSKSLEMALKKLVKTATKTRTMKSTVLRGACWIS